MYLQKKKQSINGIRYYANMPGISFLRTSKYASQFHWQQLWWRKMTMVFPNRSISDTKVATKLDLG